MNSLPSAGQMLRLLDTLGGAVRDFAAREEQLNEDFRARSAAELGKLESGTQLQESESAVGLANAEAEFDVARTRCQFNFEKRKAGIHRAHSAVRKRVLEGISELEGRGKYKIQETGAKGLSRLPQVPEVARS